MVEFQYRAFQEYESALAREPNAPETQVRHHVANVATQIFRAAWQHQSRPHVFRRWSEALRELQQGREYTPRLRLITVRQWTYGRTLRNDSSSPS
ncbi:hypothetical protein KEM55_006801 [Ascosphaera atra]|nr:hypothetical protein KEM55_006801 [Ascosphaera atra]